MPDPVIVKRNEFGLLDNIEYAYNESGGVDWRKMIKPEYLVFNLQLQSKIEDIYNKPISELSVSEVEDKYLLILLGGIKELARLRGFASVVYDVSPIGETFVSATCEIKWIGNFETENREILFSDGADATNTNTNGFGKSYLTACAINRAFVRAVKNFLGINILGKDEIPDKPNPNIQEPEEENNSPHVILKKIMDNAGVSLEKVKKVCIKNGNTNAENWVSINDIPLSETFDLIGRINKKKKE